MWSWLIIAPIVIFILYIRHQVFWGKRLYTKCPNCKMSVPRLNKGTHNCSSCGSEFEVDDRGVGTPTSLGVSILLLVSAILATYQLIFPDNVILPYHENSTLRIILNLAITLVGYGLGIHGLIIYFSKKD